VYALIVSLVASLLVAVFFPIEGPWMTIAYVTIITAVALYLPLKLGALDRYSYDERGVYLKERLLFPWRQVKRISLKFDESTGSLTLVAQPTWAALISGSLEQRETWVSYRATIVFSLRGGEVISIPSNLDRMTREGVVQKIDDLAKADNPAIEFE